MSTAKQKSICFSVTRLVIFVLICVTVLTEEPISDICAIISAGLWLWAANFVKLEIYLINKYRRWKNGG